MDSLIDERDKNKMDVCISPGMLSGAILRKEGGLVSQTGSLRRRECRQ